MLYWNHPTRLYVIEDGTKLAAFLDVFQKGQLIASQSGCGLLTSKKLQWLTTGGDSSPFVKAKRAIKRGSYSQ